VFEQVAAQVGPRAIYDVAEDAGIQPADMGAPRCALALGGLTRGVSPLEQAAAYATFAAKGTYAKPYAISSITDRRGHIVYEHSSDTSQRIDAQETGVLTAALERVVTQGTGRASGIGRPLAGKTGTTENHADGWFVGYVPQLATAVWVGYPEGQRPMTSVHGVAVAGGNFPAEMFGDYMRVALERVPVRALYTASPDDLALHAVRPSVGRLVSTTTVPESSTTVEPPVTTTTAVRTTEVPPISVATTSTVVSPTTTVQPASP
jgi:penicillin-binding protein 1A